MNYLAHAFLSNNNKDLLIGNFIADHIRGNDFSKYSPEVVKGIQLHRQIDSFTDAHPEFKKSKRFFYKGFEKYSGILIDIYFDYFLAKNFQKHSSIPLDEFSKNVYKVYLESEHLLPESSSRFLEYVIKNNVYLSYASLKGIETVLFHLSHRIKHNVRLDESVKILQEKEKDLQSSFDVFFIDVCSNFNFIS
ncbi:acyl carrier protein phosphodiesterase [Aurantibacillus circumpalustris]|uniref:acyl carrier protein phosphodiesterase n=1 Tax=Aurantibacillus circumpalustris TaxID=3036359 RepID=UPI00295A6019|nr:ACP phosphodiesterase [Aurantibacillus circumpalustris]